MDEVVLNSEQNAPPGSKDVLRGKAAVDLKTISRLLPASKGDEEFFGETEYQRRDML